MAGSTAKSSQDRPFLSFKKARIIYRGEWATDPQYQKEYLTASGEQKRVEAVLYKPVALIIRDGWGENHDPGHDKFNAVKLAHTPVADALRQRYPRTEIRTFGPDVVPFQVKTTSREKSTSAKSGNSP